MLPEPSSGRDFRRDWRDQCSDAGGRADYGAFSGAVSSDWAVGRVDAPTRRDRYAIAYRYAAADPDAAAFVNRHGHAATVAHGHSGTDPDGAFAADRHAPSNPHEHRYAETISDEHARPASHCLRDAEGNGYPVPHAIADGHSRARRPAVAILHR